MLVLNRNSNTTSLGNGADTSEDDAALVQRLTERDHEALREAYDLHGSFVFGVAMKLTADRGLAEECTQDVFMSLWDQAGSFDSGRARLTTWLYVVTRNRAIALTRQRSARPATPFADVPEVVDHTDPSEVTGQRDEARAVAEALADLPNDQRNVVVLAYVHGLTQDEIATRLNIPLGTVKGRARLALDRLRSTIDVSRISGGTS